LDAADAATYLGAGLAIFAIPFTWWLARKGRREPRLSWALDFDELAAPGDGLEALGLDLRFRGAAIDRISRSYVACWNSGGDPVRRADLLPADPVRIELGPEDLVLQSRIIYRSRSQIGCGVAQGGRSVELTWDFLDSGDGFIVEVMHRGDRPPTLKGTIVGAKVRGRGDLELTPRSLDWMRESTRRSRVRTRLAATDRRHRIIILLAIVAPLVVLAIEVVLNALDPTGLVDVHEFDLATIQGQRDFASDVREREGIEFSVVWSSVAMALAGGLIWTFGAVGLSRIPRSIVRERVTSVDEPAHEGTSPSGEGSEGEPADRNTA
jgi:hypothetical protein